MQKKISDITIPYAWKKSDWPDALLRIRSAAKAYEESNRRLDIKLASILRLQFQAKLKSTGKNQSRLIENLKKIV